MSVVSGEELANYHLLTDQGGDLVEDQSDLLAFDQEEGWYQIKKRNEAGELEEKEAGQVRLKVYEHFIVRTKEEMEGEVRAEAEVQGQFRDQDEKEGEEVNTQDFEIQGLPPADSSSRET